jgi:hypothetical protein
MQEIIVKDMETEVSTFVEENNPIAVNSNEELNRATLCIKNIKAMQNKVKESYDGIIEKAHQSHKEAIAQRDKFLNPLKTLETKFKDAILVFSKKMEAEQAERIRKANAEMARVAEEKKQKLLDEAKKTDDAWDKEELQEKAQAIVPVTCDAPGKAIEQEGLSIRKTWKARVIDESIVPRAFLVVNESALNAAAKQEGWRIAGIMGVEFYQSETANVRP